MKVNKITTEHIQTYDIGEKFYEFLEKIERHNFTKQHKRHVKRRAIRTEFQQNPKTRKFDYLEDIEGAWKVELPEWISDQRNQMTGPADDAKLCVKMINSRSPGVMLDLEDSLANTPDALLRGHENIKLALTRELVYHGNLESCDKDSPSIVFTRVRGLHMGQYLPSQDGGEKYVSASLFDLVYHFYDMDLEKLKHPPCIYIPKTEGSEEAAWWRNVFTHIEIQKGWKKGTIKCMALVESHALAYQLEKFVYNLQPYIVGLNLGRWDYMASLIENNYNDPEWFFPDRNSIPSDVAFFQNLRHRMVQVCHSRGLLAIGGMTALYPSRKNEELNQRALKTLWEDKKNEADCLMDGAWTGHPDQNEVAVMAFPEPNQLDKLPGVEWARPNILTFPGRSEFKITEDGTREAIRVCVQYRQGVLNGRGASLINGYMEDLATDRIYRIIIMQRIDMGFHEEEEIKEMFKDELDKLGCGYADGAAATLKLILRRQFNPE